MIRNIIRRLIKSLPRCAIDKFKTKKVCPRYWFNKLGVSNETFNKYLFFLCVKELRKRV